MNDPMAGSLKVGDVLYRRGTTESARVCRVTTFTVMFMVNNHFYTIPWSAVWRTFERPAGQGHAQ